jgi:hypothetical protein
MLSFDLEDWSQLVGAKFGRPGWDYPGPAFERQMRAIFDLLDATYEQALPTIWQRSGAGTRSLLASGVFV